MKLILPLLFTAAVAPWCARAVDDLPKGQSFARYEAMMNRSPFAIATAVAPPPQAPNFAKDLFIANAARLADEGVVTLTSNTDKNLKEYLSTKGPNKSGYSISNIEWSDRVGATKVTIAKDGQFATLTFNQALLSQPVANAPQQQQLLQPPPIQQQVAAPVPQVPQQFTPQGLPAAQTPNYNSTNVIKPAPIPTLPTPPPRVRGVIQRNASNSAVNPQPEPPGLQDQ